MPDIEEEEGDDVPYVDEDDDSALLEKEKSGVTCKETAVRVWAAVTIIANVGSMVLKTLGGSFGALDMMGQVGRGILYVSGLLGFGISVFIVREERKLSNGNSIKDLLDALNGDIDNLAEENEKLTGENDKLRDRVDRLKVVENGLNDLVAAGGETIDSFMNLMKENERINMEMKEVLAAQTLEKVVSVVIASDKDRNFTIDEEDLDELIMRMDCIKELVYDQEKFRELVKKEGNSVENVVGIVVDMMDVRDDEITGGGSNRRENSLMSVTDSSEFFESARQNLK